MEASELEAEEVFPFDINPLYEGERIRKEDLFVELCGQSKPGFELVLYEPDPETIKDGEVTPIGPDLTEMEEGGTYAYAMIYKVHGKQIDKDLEAVRERKNHEYQGYMMEINNE